MGGHHVDAAVAIIGYGPTGVSAANFLGSQGVSAIVLERWNDVYQRARAVTVDDWTLRCFQSVGLADALTADMDVTHSIRWRTYAGQDLRHVTFPPGTMGYATSYAIYQPTMEQTLRDGATRFCDRVEVRYGTAATDIEQDDDGVTLTVADTDTGEVTRVRTRYALACDGGSSTTRDRLGISLLGDTGDTQWVVIDAKVKRWWPNRHILTHWSDQRRPVVDIALAGDNHRWELPLEPQESEADFTTHEQLWPLLETMGVTKDQVEIHRHAFYRHHVRHAERWRQGRVFLLGDAAHLMPPWAGQGMQSGIRDAHNLSWKLAAVLSGRLPADVLDTYELERAPDVQRRTEQSKLLGRMVRLDLSERELAALRTGPGTAQQQARVSTPAVDAGWLTGQPGEDSAVGRMIPQPRIVASNGRKQLLDELIGNGFELLGDGIDPGSLLSDEERSGWAALGASFRTVLSPDRPSADASDVIDIDGTLLDWMRHYGARVIALRPDRLVAAADTGGLAVPGRHPAAPHPTQLLRSPPGEAVRSTDIESRINVLEAKK